MHNLYAIFAKLLNICKQIAGNLVNESGNVPRRGVVPKFSDLEVVALNMTSEAVGIDSESLLFAKLQEYRIEIPNLISRRQFFQTALFQPTALFFLFTAKKLFSAFLRFQNKNGYFKVDISRENFTLQKI